MITLKRSTLLALLVIPMLFETLLMGCAALKIREPIQNIYIGDPSHQALLGPSGSQPIACASPQFGDMLCLSKNDFYKFCVPPTE